MTHNMKLNDEPFQKIESGKKTIELRLYDEKRQKIMLGDTIEFVNRTSGKILRAEVVGLHIFKSFADLYKSLPLEKCGYSKEEIPSASPADMEKYYSPQEQKLFGTIGIEIKLV